jgi:hypothetical protein
MKAMPSLWPDPSDQEAAQILGLELNGLTSPKLEHALFLELSKLKNSEIAKNQALITEIYADLEWAYQKLLKFLEGNNKGQSPLHDPLKEGLPDLLIGSPWQEAQNMDDKKESTSAPGNIPFSAMGARSMVAPPVSRAPSSPIRAIPQKPPRLESSQRVFGQKKDLAPTRASITFDEFTLARVWEIIHKYPVPTGTMFLELRNLAGIERAELSRVLKISELNLESLETDRFDRLPATVYLRGFAAAYLRFFGVEGTQFAEKYIQYVQSSKSSGRKV